MCVEAAVTAASQPCFNRTGATGSGEEAADAGTNTQHNRLGRAEGPSTLCSVQYDEPIV